MLFKRKMIFALSILMLISLWYGDDGLSVQPQLIARWPLDEGSGNLVQDVIGDNDGKRVGGADWVKAKFENGLQFNKKTGQYVEIPRALELEPTDSLTVMVWVNVSSAAGRQELFCYADSYDILINNGVFKTYIHQGGAFPRAAGKTPVETNKWYFLAMTYDGKDLNLYVNGKLDGSAKLPGGIQFLTMPLRFSNNPAAPNEAWGISGILDEVELWDKPMAETEIIEAYESPLSFLSVNSQANITAIWGRIKTTR